MRARFTGMFLNEGEKENKRSGEQRQDTRHVYGGEKQEKEKEKKK